MAAKIEDLPDGMIAFDCPACGMQHAIPVDGSRGWRWNGDYIKPTITPSILTRYTVRLTEEEIARVMVGEAVDKPKMVCHSFVTDGHIQYCGDCTHALAGQTVDLPDIGDV